MKKVRITESQLKGLVRRMIRENVGMDLKVGDAVKFPMDDQQYKITKILSPTQIEFLDGVNNKKYIFNPQNKKYEKIEKGGEIYESQLRGLVKRIIKEEVIVKKGYSMFSPKGEIDVTDSDIELAKRLENYLQGLDIKSVEVSPEFRHIYTSTPDNTKGRKHLFFKVHLLGRIEKSDKLNTRGGKNDSYNVAMFLRRLNVPEIKNRIKKFFSANPNNYTLTEHPEENYSNWGYDEYFNVNGMDYISINFAVIDESSFMSDKSYREKDIYSDPMGKRRSQGGF